MYSAKPGATLTREQRLAAQLRANLRRRKQQARALGQQQPSHDQEAPELKPAVNPAPDEPPMAKPPLAKPRDDG